MDKMRHQSQVILICIKIVLNATRPYFYRKIQWGGCSVSIVPQVCNTNNTCPTTHRPKANTNNCLPIQRYRDELSALFRLCVFFLTYSNFISLNSPKPRVHKFDNLRVKTEIFSSHAAVIRTFSSFMFILSSHVFKSAY